MYDNVDLVLTRDHAGNIDLLAEVPCRLQNVKPGTHDGNNYANGYIGSLKVKVTANRVSVYDSSLCKWYFGENFQTLSRGDTKRAIEKLSDVLCLPMQMAYLNRVDLAQNFILKYDPDVYFNHLGTLQYFTRLPQNKGLYYNGNNKQLVFYKKVDEYLDKKLPVPVFYQNRNVLRYEMRFTGRLLSQFNVPELRAEMLYDERFYMNIINRWHEHYKTINKIRETNIIDYTMIKTKEQLKTQAVLFLVDMQGGELEFLNKLDEAQKKGELTKKQKFDLKTLITDACKSKVLTTESDVITELDKKIKEAVKYYV
jgi:hypothetical protein